MREKTNSYNQLLRSIRRIETDIYAWLIVRWNKVMPALLVMLATVCMIIVCAVSYCSIRTDASSGFKYYTCVTVENGETLWDIADEFIDYNYYKNKNSYITEVQCINHLDENCSIDAGQVLILPYYSNQYIR